MKTKLTNAQENKFKRLEIGLKEACSNGELEKAKILIKDIQSLAKSTGQNIRWLFNLCYLCETAITYGDYTFAITHLHNAIVASNKNTRLLIAAHALLAGVYIRNREEKSAQLHIQKAIQNISHIKSKKRRNIFYKKIILKFEEESILFGVNLSFKLNLDEE